MRKISLIAAAILIFVSCAKNAPVNEPGINLTPDVQELVDELAVKEHKIYNCRYKKYYWQMTLIGNIAKEDGLDFQGFISATLAQDRVEKKDKTLTITTYMSAQNKTTGIWTTYGEIFIDKNADGKPEYVKYTKIKNKKTILKIEFKDGKEEVSGSQATSSKKEVGIDEINALYWKTIALILQDLKDEKIKHSSPWPSRKY